MHSQNEVPERAEPLLLFDEVLFPDVSKHFQIVVGVDAADLALHCDLEALLAYDLSLRGLLELLPDAKRGTVVLTRLKQVKNCLQSAHLGQPKQHLA